MVGYILSTSTQFILKSCMTVKLGGQLYLFEKPDRVAVGNHCPVTCHWQRCIKYASIRNGIDFTTKLNT